jgi:hypothetical protein
MWKTQAWMGVILKWSFKEWDGGMDRTSLAEDRGMWQALVKDLVASQ